MVSKEELNKIYTLGGEVRGVTLQTDAKYILEKRGQEGLNEVEKRLKTLGFSIPYRTAKTLEWYPLGLRVISLLVIKDSFNFTDREIREMGKVAPKFSFVVKFLFKLFGTLKKLSKEVPKYWKEHYSIGSLETVKLDEKKKIIVIHLKEFKVHPILCIYLEGYFEGTFRFAKPGGVCQETKCAFKDNLPYHQYTFTWK